jgi:hypothetical protein
MRDILIDLAPLFMCFEPSLGFYLVRNPVDFIGGDEIRVFDAIWSRPTGPADVERIVHS